MKTISIDRWGGQRRSGERNAATRVCSNVVAPSFDARRHFVRAYAKIADTCRAVDEPGVALFAVDEATGEVAGLACIRARVDRHVAAIVGRHDQCDLSFAGSERLALRQLAVVLAPVRSWKRGQAEVSFRVLDLRTADGMVDEESRPLRGLRSEGPVVVRCGGYLIYVLPLGDPTDWPASASDAWAAMPERVYFDELARRPEGSVARGSLALRTPGTTVVVRTGGPRDTSMRLVTNGDVAGTLRFQGATDHGAIAVGYQALRDGLLLGRYARCDGAELCNDHLVSRVHALLLLTEDRLIAIDTASSNGTREVGRSDARVIELVGGSEIELGGQTRVSWHWMSLP